MKLPPGLLDALISSPDAQAGYLVAADWLTSAGDPWGEFISAQCRLVGETDPSQFMALRRRAEALLEANSTRWLGTGDAEVDWRWGFVERLTLHETGPLEAVLRSQVGGLLRTLSLEGGPTALGLALERLHRLAPPRLEGLALSGKGLVEGAVPPVRRLQCTGLSLEWARIDAEKLVELRLIEVRDAGLRGWLEGEGPTALQHLELLELALPLHTTQRFIERQTSLEALHLEDDLPDDLAVWLAQSPVLSKLEHLALGGPATDVGLDAMLRHFARFSRLKTLIVYGGRYGPTVKKWAYKQLPQLVFEARRPPSGWATRRR